MVEIIRGEIYQCGISTDKVPCNVRKEQFQSLSKSEVESHEKEHQNFIATDKRRTRLREQAEKILVKKIDQWEYWRNLWQLTQKLNFVVQRQPLMGGQSLGTFECGIGLVASLRRLIEAGAEHEEMVSEVLDAVLDGAWWEEIDEKESKKEAKEASKHLPELWRLVARVARETNKIKKKFGDLLDDTEEVVGEIKLLRSCIRDDVKTLSKQGCRVIIK